MVATFTSEQAFTRECGHYWSKNNLEHYSKRQAAFPAASLIFSGIHHRVDMPHSTTNLTIDKINNELRVLCDQKNINFGDNNAESTHQAPDIYRLNNHDVLHLNIHGRKKLCERLANLILPGRHVITRPTPTIGMCRRR